MLQARVRHSLKLTPELKRHHVLAPFVSRARLLLRGIADSVRANGRTVGRPVSVVRAGRLPLRAGRAIET